MNNFINKNQFKENKIQIVLVYALLIYAILARLFWGVSFVLAGGGIWNSDIIILILILIYFFYSGNRIKIETGGQKSLLLILVIFLMPTLIGVMNGNDIITVLRDARVIPYYIAIFVVMNTLNSKKKIQNIVNFAITFSVLNLLLFFIMLIFNLHLPAQMGIDTAYDMGYATIERFGISSATFFYPFIALLLFNMYLDKIIYINKIIHIGLIVGFLFAIFYYAMRTFIIGVVIAFIVNIIVRIRKKNIIPVIYVLIILSFGLIAFSSLDTLLEIPQIRRIATVVDPTLSHRGVQNNMEVRIKAIRLAVDNTNSILLGSGFGDQPIENSLRRYNLARWWNHSSYAWAIYKLGVFLTLVYMISLLLILRRSLKIAKFISDNSIKPIIYSLVFYIISIIGLAAGTNILFRGDFLTLYFCIAMAILLSIEKYYTHNIE